MRAAARWVAAALLITLALVGGPDVLDAGPPASHAQAAAAGDLGGARDSQVRDDALDSPHRIADRVTPGHVRPAAALPPSPRYRRAPSR